jgi:hypothetical protein
MQFGTLKLKIKAGVSATTTYQQPDREKYTRKY